jgi:hypothetical protein
MKNNLTIKNIYYFLLFLCLALAFSGVKSNAQGDNKNFSQIEIPIDASSANKFTKIRRIIFTEEDYELAILQASPSTIGIYIGVVFVKIESDYECRLKVLDISSGVTTDGIDLEKISHLKPKVMRRKIEQDIMDSLKECLERQVLRASYASKDRYDVLDDVKHECYVQSKSKIFCAKITSAYPPNTGSIGNIVSALEDYVKGLHPESLKQVISFIRLNPEKVGMPREIGADGDKPDPSRSLLPN